jgi:hypothetical protein
MSFCIFILFILIKFLLYQWFLPFFPFGSFTIHSLAIFLEYLFFLNFNFFRVSIAIYIKITFFLAFNKFMFFKIILDILFYIILLWIEILPVQIIIDSKWLLCLIIFPKVKFHFEWIIVIDLRIWQKVLIDNLWRKCIFCIKHIKLLTVDVWIQTHHRIAESVIFIVLNLFIFFFFIYWNARCLQFLAQYVSFVVQIILVLIYLVCFLICLYYLVLS